MDIATLSCQCSSNLEAGEIGDLGILARGNQWAANVPILPNDFATALAAMEAPTAEQGPVIHDRQ